MLLFFSLLGLFLSVLFLTFNAGKNTTTRYLGSFFFLLSLYVFFQWGLLYSRSFVVVRGLLATFAFAFSPIYLIGPMLYWYVRGVLSDHHRLRRHDLLHLLPMVIYFAAALPYTFWVPLAEKAETARQVVANTGIIQTYTPTVLSELFPVMDVYLSRPVLVMGYALWSMALIARYYYQDQLRRVFERQHFMLSWLMLLTGLTLLTSLTHSILIVEAFRMNFSPFSFGLNLVRILSALGLTGLLASPFFFPAILYGLPRLPATSQPPGAPPARKKGGDPGNTLNHFESAYLGTVARRMDHYMKEHQPYLQPQFNISQLAVQLEVPVHHLGYYFREVKGQTFSEYRNRWRVEHAKKLIREGRCHELTLEAIALLSGFSNRNAFRSVFQKTEGVCPSTFAAARPGEGGERD